MDKKNIVLLLIISCVVLGCTHNGQIDEEAGNPSFRKSTPPTEELFITFNKKAKDGYIADVSNSKFVEFFEKDAARSVEGETTSIDFYYKDSNQVIVWFRFIETDPDKKIERMKKLEREFARKWYAERAEAVGTYVAY